MPKAHGIAIQSGLYSPASGKPGEYDFHPEKWPETKKLLDSAAERWITGMRNGAITQAEREASNVVCLEHRKKLSSGEHVNDGGTRCNHRRYARKAQPARTGRPQAAS